MGVRFQFPVDANGAMTSDGLRTFEYDESKRLSKVKILQDGEAASVAYLHNALGQRVFKSQPQMLFARQAWDLKWRPHHSGTFQQSNNAINNIKKKMQAAGCDCAGL
jgi:hypothetical protein